jgi:hypothetical protein
MELDQSGEERKNRCDVMADDSPDSDNADGFLPTASSSCGELPAPPFLWQRAEEDDEHREVEPPADVEVADVDVDASSDPGMGSGAGDPAGGRRSREKHPSIVVYAFALARVLSGFACLLGVNTIGLSMEEMAAMLRRLRTSSSSTPTPPT